MLPYSLLFRFPSFFLYDFTLFFSPAYCVFSSQFLSPSPCYSFFRCLLFQFAAGKFHSAWKNTDSFSDKGRETETQSETETEGIDYRHSQVYTKILYFIQIGSHIEGTSMKNCKNLPSLKRKRVYKNHDYSGYDLL